MQLFNIEDASYQELRVVQEKLLELLKFYDSFCKKHNLKYWLAGGSMIGAIREGGIIPWDDDIDVFMPMDDNLLKNNSNPSFLWKRKFALPS